jgi:hypothetical protein
MIDESLISAHNGTNFVIEKVTKKDENNNDYIISQFKYKQDVIHNKINSIKEAEIYVGGCNACGWDLTKAQYDNATWGDVLYLGLYMGLTPEYIYSNKTHSIDVIESDQEIIDYVTWINNNINVIQHDEWTYATSKKYDIIICDLWAEPDDITQDHKTKLINNYTNNLKDGGKIIIPISGETIN